MANVIIIEVGLRERNYWHDLGAITSCFYVLASRDLSVRYKQTVIGAAWAGDPAGSDDGDLYLPSSSAASPSCHPTATPLTR